MPADPPAPGVTAGGGVPDRSYRSLVLELEPGDLLMVYTDGVTEAENSIGGEPFGVPECQRLLEGGGQAPLEALIDRLRESLRGFTSSDHLEDDGTLMLLRRRTTAGLRKT